MPELTISGGGRTVQAWGLTGRVVWSGDKQRAARTLSFTLAASESDPNLPAVECPLGAQVRLTADDGTSLFLGMAVSRTLATGGAQVNITAHDRGIYLVNNDGTYRFRGVTAEQAARQLCGDYGIPAGRLASTGVRINRKFASVSLWSILSTMYSLAADQTGRRYLARFSGEGELEVTVREEQGSSLVIQPGSNLLTASTTDSITALRNSVAIYDKNGTLLQTVGDQDSIALYGMMQRHIRQADGENAYPQAKAILADCAPAQTVTVECLGDARLTAGETVVVRQAYTGLSGVFWIDADTHTWTNGKYTCRLTLNCRNVMYTSSAGGDL